MKEYDVIVTHNSTMSTLVRVEANTPQEAENLALDLSLTVGG